MNTTGYTESSGRLHHSVISRSRCGPMHVGEVRGAAVRHESAVNSGVTSGAKTEARTTVYPRRPSNTKRVWPY
jgi:hypothetical protein